jgi:hypothetical protein
MFNVGEEVMKKKLKKDPTIDTSFLPDPERQEAERMEREKLKRQWLESQVAVKAEDVTIKYEYVSEMGRPAVITVRFVLVVCLYAPVQKGRHDLCVFGKVSHAAPGTSQDCRRQSNVCQERRDIAPCAPYFAKLLIRRRITRCMILF